MTTPLRKRVLRFAVSGALVVSAPLIAAGCGGATAQQPEQPPGDTTNVGPQDPPPDTNVGPQDPPPDTNVGPQDPLNVNTGPQEPNPPHVNQGPQSGPSGS